MKGKVIQTPVAPLTHTPDQNAVLQDEIFYGMPITVLEETADWLYVETPYRYRGYIPAACAAGCAYPADLTVTAAFGDLLSGPSVNSALRLSVPRGANLLSCGEKQDGWLPVRTVSRETCYIKADRVSPFVPYALPQDAQSFRKAVLRTAYTYLHTPYRWGGKTPQGIDCSGFCSMCYLLNGVVIYRDASMQPGFPVRPVPLEYAAEGDLLYFPGHIALYLGAGRFLHATARDGDDCVTEASLNPSDPGFRADLTASLLTAGSIFAASP